MDLELAGKVVLITGASGGLGREMAVDFAREEARVVVHYRSGVEAAEVVADTIENMGGEAITAQADLTDRAAVQHMLNLIKGEYGGVDVLIHGASRVRGRRADRADGARDVAQDDRSDIDGHVSSRQRDRALS